jgi:uncharacterized protein (TIGR00369 family)
VSSPDFVEFYRSICHFDRFMGLELSLQAPGRINYHLTAGEQHLSMPGACHGGVIAAMMDAVLGLTALSAVFEAGKLCQTVEFKINYLRAVAPGTRLVGEGRVEFSGNRLLVTSATIEDAANQRAIAKGMGTFSLYPMDKNDLWKSLSQQTRQDYPANSDPQLTP